MRQFIIALILLIVVGVALSQEVPKNFLIHKDTLTKVIHSSWEDITIPSVIPSLIEQETCYSLTHPKCWSPNAKLETSREYGFGLGQLTVTPRFNAFEEVKGLDSRLKNWQWNDRFNPEFQMIGVVSMLKRNYNIFRNANNEYNRYAFALASYNGGIGGIQADQRICRSTSGCDATKWFGHTEYTSLKKKTKVAGYGKSFFEINREYPKNILEVRRYKYKPYIDEGFPSVTY